MDGKRSAYSSLIRRAKTRPGDVQWKTVLVSGLVGLLGAVVGGGLSYAATARQVGSAEEIAVAARAHEDQLDRIARRNDVYAEFYGALVTLDAVAQELDTRVRLSDKSRDQLRDNLQTSLQVRKDLTGVYAKFTAVQLQGSPAVTNASVRALDAAASVSSVHDFFAPYVDEQDLAAFEASMDDVLEAMRADLNVNDGQTTPSLRDLLKRLQAGQ